MSTLRIGYLNVAKTSHRTDMGKPVGKASGRTFSRITTYVSDPCWNSLYVASSHSPKNVKSIAFRSLEGRFTHGRLCTYEGYLFTLTGC